MTELQVMKMYQSALKQILKENKAFLKLYDDVMSGKIQPPEYYVLAGKEDVWRQGFLREKMRQEALIEKVQNTINKIGGAAAAQIKHDNTQAFIDNYGKMCGDVINQCKGYHIRADFSQYSEEQVRMLIDEQTPVFTKIAYNNLGNNVAAVRKLKGELGQAIITGESQTGLAKRLQKVVGYTAAQAWRTAQTERQRVQSMAEDNVGEQCRQQGIVIEWEWVCHFLPTIPGRKGTGSRDSHKDLHGKKVLQGQSWKTINGYELRYPCDPEAPARETINCHCSRIQRVVPPDEVYFEQLAKNPLYVGLTPDSYKAGAQVFTPTLAKSKGTATPVVKPPVVDTYDSMKAAGGGVTDWVSPEDQKAVKDLVDTQQKLQGDLDKVNQHVYSGIWYNKDVTPADYGALSAKVQAKKDYYNNQLSIVTDQAKIDEFNKHLADLDEFEMYGKEYLSIKTDIDAAKKQLADLQKDIAVKQGKTLIDDPYTDARKNAALWAKTAKEADDQLRDYVGVQWRNATQAERESAYKYTYTYSPFNEPLRGIEYGTNAYKGVGNTDLNGGRAGADINRMTQLIDRCQIPVDMWAQRGCRLGGMDKFLGVSPSVLTSRSQSAVEQALLGKQVTDFGFMSAGCSKGQGFGGQIIMNIYAPKGTKAIYAEPFSHYGNGQKLKWDGIAKQHSFGHEDEIIFQQGTKMRITKVEVTGGTIFLDLDVIGTEKSQLW